MPTDPLQTSAEFVARVRRFVRTQASATHPRLLLAQAAARALPDDAFGPLRSRLYRHAGFVGIAEQTAFHGPADFRGRGDIFSRLHVGTGTTINHPVVFDLNADIHVGDNVAIGNHVLFMTSGHVIGGPAERCGSVTPHPIRIGDGSWLGAGVIVLPGATVGRGAVVGAGAVVARDVPPNTLAVGAPARPVRNLLGISEGVHEAVPAQVRTNA